ncbi:Protein of unknown function [Pyronema omphalodes CBS 100304]|uniref:OmpA-like domain-containing protein n=1 Tax=Pyronema omphalodes (strain CBS 100304) TaxID=1076935 RepID=U4LT24_PYROM|nr:Protein of unknown function [Pyronema omphalodes CBS 100304]
MLLGNNRSEAGRRRDRRVLLLTPAAARLRASRQTAQEQIPLCMGREASSSVAPGQLKLPRGGPGAKGADQRVQGPQILFHRLRASPTSLKNLSI